MAVAQVAHHLVVVGTGTTDFVYTEPIPMAGANAIHVVIACYAFTGSGSPRIRGWPQISSDLDNWTFFGATLPSFPLVQFAGVAVVDATIAPGSTSPYNVAIGAKWVRFALRVETGTVVEGGFTVRANTFRG